MNDVRSPHDLAGALAAGLHAEAPELSVTTLEFTKRVARLQALVETATAPVLHAHGLSRGEYDVLATLRSIGAPYRLKPSELAQRLLFTTGGTSNLLRSLEAKGYVDRTPDPSDGRSSWVGLTRSGAEAAIAVVRDAVAVQNRLLDPAGAGVLRSVIDGVATVLDNAETTMAGVRR